DTLNLQATYAPIAAELERVRSAFRNELNSDQPFIETLADHVAQYHGKMLRPALVLLVGQSCGTLKPSHITLGAVVEMVHIATLVHDDILDEADVRRRVPTINTLVGNERAVLLGDYLISHSYHLCSSLASQYASRRVAATTNRVCEGEMMQVAHRNDWALSEATYLDIVERKTASLIGTCCGLGAWASDAETELVAQFERFGNSLGIAFQIVDDILDLIGDEAVVGKSVGRDADKGKLTLPMIHFLRTASAPACHEFQRILEKMRTAGPDFHINGHEKTGHDDKGDISPATRTRTCGQHGTLQSDLLGLLQQTKSLDYARNVAARYVETARDAVTVLPESPARHSLLTMTDFVLARRH
ncbi:MAG: polyprenyl synthetase family protein, partial [Thermomicrobiales bacterium]